MVGDQAPEHLGRWFEELPVGFQVRHAVTRTLLDSDNLLFCGMTMNPAAIHLDAHHAATQTEFGRPLINSLLTLGLVVGLSVYETTHGTTVANLGFREISFPKPVFGGDTIRVQTEVLESRSSSSRPEAGIVTFRHEGRNQVGDVICSAVRLALMRCKPT